MRRSATGIARAIVIAAGLVVCAVSICFVAIEINGWLFHLIGAAICIAFFGGLFAIAHDWSVTGGFCWLFALVVTKLAWNGGHHLFIGAIVALTLPAGVFTVIRGIWFSAEQNEAEATDLVGEMVFRICFEILLG